MPRLLTALATLTVGLMAPLPPAPPTPGPDLAPAALPGSALPGSAVGTDPGAEASSPANAPPAADAVPVPEATQAAIPEAIAADLDAFGASQGWGAPVERHLWLTDLNGDGTEDALAEVRYATRDATATEGSAATGAAETALYHFPYFAEGPGYRRGSAMGLADGILSVAWEKSEGGGKALAVTSRDPQRDAEGDPAATKSSDDATEGTAPPGTITMRLRF